MMNGLKPRGEELYTQINILQNGRCTNLYASTLKKRLSITYLGNGARFYNTPDPEYDAWSLITGMKRPAFDPTILLHRYPSLRVTIQKWRTQLNVSLLLREKESREKKSQVEIIALLDDLLSLVEREVDEKYDIFFINTIFYY